MPVLHPNYLLCYSHYSPEHTLLTRFIPHFWSLVCVCVYARVCVLFQITRLVKLFKVRFAGKKPCRIGPEMRFSGSDCCDKPCAGMHNNQLIDPSCCHHQKCKTNTIFSLLHPLQSPFSLSNKTQVSKVCLKKKAFLGFACPIQGLKRKAAINTRCLRVWPRG